MGDKDFFEGRSLAASKAKRLAGGAPAARVPPMPASAPEPAPSASPSPSPSPPRMVPIGDKPVVRREAVAEGFLRLSPRTLAALASGALPKGDPFPVARVAGILAAKATPQLIPLCHPIPLTSVEVDLVREERGVRAKARVVAEWKTGVEMEALAAVSAALLTVWDMTKALEKDATGNYPDTAIEAIRVLSKTKSG